MQTNVRRYRRSVPAAGPQRYKRVVTREASSQINIPTDVTQEIHEQNFSTLRQRQFESLGFVYESYAIQVVVDVPLCVRRFTLVLRLLQVKVFFKNIQSRSVICNIRSR